MTDATKLHGPEHVRVYEETDGEVGHEWRKGSPILILTTTGRKSGQPRTQPLLYVRDGENFVVIGSNWGQQGHPAWSVNLLATPDAVVTLDGRELPVRGVLADGAERERLWQLLLTVWPAYQTYQERASNRVIRIFSLVPR